MSGDLHIYTEYSGGDWDAEHIFQFAKNSGLSTIAFTDRERVDNNEKGQLLQERFGMTFIPGVELCAQWRGKELHVLGYFIKSSNKYLEKHLKLVRELKNAAAERSVEKLRYFGLKISLDEIHELMEDKKAPGWPLLRLMIQKGYVKNFIDYYQKYLAYGKPGYVKVDYPELEDILDVIDFSGGLAVLAHPASLKVDSEVFKEIMSQKIKGIEVFSPYHTEEDIRFYKDYAEKHRLLVFGGSESFGTLLPNKVGDVTISQEEIDRIIREKMQLNSQ